MPQVELKNQPPATAEDDEVPGKENALKEKESGDGNAAKDEARTVQEPVPWGHYGAGYVEFDFRSPSFKP